MGGLKIKKGDKVEVLAGKYRGKQGKVLKSFPESRRVVVEGVNLVKRHTRPSQENPQGGIVTKEAPIDISNVALVCDSCSRRIRVGYRFDSDDVKRRVCRKCGADLD
ncbi:MAG: 50S ribosomal protein L24 [Actinomycetota bacterium]|nr:50S ribosomal protein L24 [Actinomycetota bacterium]MDD5666397.1 50S ribosomal protein L24 [Actinomycetota bacterium]